MLSSSSYSWPIAMAAVIFCLLTSVTYVFRTKQIERTTTASAPMTRFTMLSADTNNNHDRDIQPSPKDKAEDLQSLPKDQIPKNNEVDNEVDTSHNKDDKKNEKEKTKKQPKEDKEEKESKKNKNKDKQSSSKKDSSSKKHKDETNKKNKKDDLATDNAVSDKEEEEEETYNREKQSKLPMMHGSHETPPHIVFILGMFECMVLTSLPYSLSLTLTLTLAHLYFHVSR